MKITLINDFGVKKKGTSFEVSSPTAINLIKKGIAIKFGEEVVKPKTEKKQAKTEK